MLADAEFAECLTFELATINAALAESWECKRNGKKRQEVLKKRNTSFRFYKVESEGGKLPQGWPVRTRKCLGLGENFTEQFAQEVSRCLKTTFCTHPD